MSGTPLVTSCLIEMHCIAWQAFVHGAVPNAPCSDWGTVLQPVSNACVFITAACA